jgi:hypothetical protein
MEQRSVFGLANVVVNRLLIARAFQMQRQPVVGTPRLRPQLKGLPLQAELHGLLCLLRELSCYGRVNPLKRLCSQLA